MMKDTKDREKVWMKRMREGSLHVHFLHLRRALVE